MPPRSLTTCAPKPAYRTERLELYQSDCRVVLPLLVGIDAVITDPPYGIAYRNNRGNIRPHKVYDPVMDGDSAGVGQVVLDECFCYGWPVCTFAYHRTPWAGEWRQYLVWDKGGAVGGGGHRDTYWKFTWELIQVGGFGKLNGQRDGSVLRFWVGQQDFHDHPTQKPLPLMRYLVAKLTQPGQRVLDPFMGSGTTGVACLELGRRFVGIESDRGYFDVACRRVVAADTSCLVDGAQGVLWA